MVRHGQSSNHNKTYNEVLRYDEPCSQRSSQRNAGQELQKDVKLLNSAKNTHAYFTF